MLLTVFSICAVLYAGEYDCDEKWDIYVYEEREVQMYCYPNRSINMMVAGCAFYDHNKGYKIIIGNGGKGISHTGESVLEHELKHLKCLCDFHAIPPEPPKR